MSARKRARPNRYGPISVVQPTVYYYNGSGGRDKGLRSPSRGLGFLGRTGAGLAGLVVSGGLGQGLQALSSLKGWGRACGPCRLIE